WAGAVTPGYFAAMGVPLMAGRTFSEADGERAASVVVVSASTARRYWPGQDAVGKQIRVVWDRNWRTVVGVVGDVRQRDLAREYPDFLTGAFYMPYSQAVALNREIPAAMTLVARTAGDPIEVGSRLRALVMAQDPNVPVSELQTMEGFLSSSTSQQ